MCYGVPGQILFGFPVGDPAITRIGYSVLEQRGAPTLTRIVRDLRPDLKTTLPHEVGLVEAAPGTEQRTIASLHQEVAFRAMELSAHDPATYSGAARLAFAPESDPPFLIEPNAPMATSHPAAAPTDFVLNPTHDAAAVAMLGLGVGQGAGVRVGVLDSGFTAPLCSSLQGVNPSTALNLLDWDDQSLKHDVDDGDGHGTSMAGIIHEHAPSADLVVVRVADDSGCTTTWHVMAGLAVAVDCQVLNVSIASSPQATAFACSHLSHELVSANLAAIVRDTSARDAVIVAAAGNQAKSELSYPARIAQSLAVVSVSSTKALSGFSNHGTQDDACQPHPYVFAAPGGDGQMASGMVTEPVGADTQGLEEFVGTSYAAAYATAAVAQYRGLHANKTRDEVLTDLVANADNTFTGYDKAKHGHGVLTVP
jgi:hypothetical protein